MAPPDKFWENLFGAGITAGGLALGLDAYNKLGETGKKGYEELAGYTTEEGEFVPG